MVSSQDNDNDEDSLTDITASLSSLEEEEDYFGFALSPPRSPEQSTTTDRSSSPQKDGPRRVRFDSVIIRHYGRTVDDHPCAETGPALTLTWDVQQQEEWTMEEFEQYRLYRRHGQAAAEGTSAASAPPLRRVSPKVRKNMLLQEWDVCPNELRNAMYWSQHMQRQRKETLYELQQGYWYHSTPTTTDEEEYLMMMNEYGYVPAATSSTADCREDYDDYGNRFETTTTMYDEGQQVQLDYYYQQSREKVTTADCYIDAEEEVEPHLLAYHQYY